MIADELLTLPQIAEMLGVNHSTVRLWVSEGRLPADKAGGRKWLVRAGDLQQMLDNQPHIGKPRTIPKAEEPPTDWSQIDTASSIEPDRTVR